MEPTFSLVIPCYNEEKYIGKLLDQICAQTVTPKEVIIADSNSTDKTIAKAQEYADRLPIKIAHTTIRTPGGARNAGAKLATATYIIFLDADCLPVGRHFFERLLHELLKKPVDFISPVFTSDGWHPLDYLFFWMIDFFLITGLTFKGIPAIGGMMCIKRETHQRIKGFNSELKLEDDIDYGRKLTAVHATHRTLPFLFVVASNRRSKHEGRVNALLHSTPTESRIGKHVHRHLNSTGKEKKYGIF